MRPQIYKIIFIGEALEMKYSLAMVLISIVLVVSWVAML